MHAEIKTLYESSLCSVHDFLCRCHECSMSEKEQRDDFVIAYIRRGNFQFNSFRRTFDAHHGHFLLNKPHHEYRVGHVHAMPDECTIFSMPAENVQLLSHDYQSFGWFLNDPDKKSILIPATPETEYLHHCLFQLVSTHCYSRLHTESLLSELFLKILSVNEQQADVRLLTDRQKRNLLPGLEKIKTFISEHFVDDISVTQLADLGNMSQFHFARSFKQLTSVTPYQYLLRVRLQQAHQNLQATSLPISEIAFSAGFNSLEHFSASYKKWYGKAPSLMRG